MCRNSGHYGHRFESKMQRIPANKRVVCIMLIVQPILFPSLPPNIAAERTASSGCAGSQAKIHCGMHVDSRDVVGTAVA